MKKFLDTSYEITMGATTKTLLTIGIHRLLLLSHVVMILILVNQATWDVAGHIINCTEGAVSEPRP